MATPQEIINYYAFSKWDYRLYNLRFWDLSMHYGLWDETTRTHRQALLNENRIAASVGRVSSGDSVIDLGCGYGSTAVWLASNIGCRVLGITLSEEQVHAAQRLARARRVQHLVSFAAMDFHKTDLADGSFDVALAIESLAHSSSKITVLKESWRILKPGGRIVLADGFFQKSKNAMTIDEQRIARTCFEGVHVPPVPERHEFEGWLENAGFVQIRWLDKTVSILPTAKRVHRLGKTLLPISRILGKLGVHAFQESHMRAFVNQYYAFRDGLGAYGMFSATKPLPRQQTQKSSK